MMKKITAILLALILVLGTLSIPAFAQETSDKLDEEVKIAIERSEMDEFLYVDVYVRYPRCPEPPFTENDYGRDLASIQAYRHDYIQYKIAYNTTQCEKAVETLSAAVDFELVSGGLLTPCLSLNVKVRDVETLASQEIVSYITLNDKTMMRDRSASLYEEKFIETLKYSSQKALYEYSELFYHHDTEGNLDWVLVKGCSGYVGEIVVQMEIGGRVITYGDARDFKFGYGVFDVEQDRFIDLYDIRDDVESYKNLREVLWALQIGRPVGDADNDGEVTVMDATAIQKALAGISGTLNPNADIYRRGSTDMQDHCFSDFDKDGKLTILDATRIQKFKANLIDLDGNPIIE